MKIAIAGLGFVGLSNAVLLAQPLNLRATTDKTDAYIGSSEAEAIKHFASTYLAES